MNNEASLVAARRAFLAVAVLHFALLTGGFFVLAANFGFPDILRAPAAERFAAFRAGQHIIVPAYYAMALTGLTQIALAVLGHRALTNKDGTLALGALIAGVLGGAWQAMGFIRWAVTIPHLAAAMADATGESAHTIALMEGMLNAYAGMAIGEHLGFVGQGFWTLLFALAALSTRTLPRTLSVIGVVFGVGFLVASLEQIGLEAIGQLSTPLTAAWFAWIIMAGVSLTRSGAGEAARFRIVSLIAFLVLAGGLVAATLG